MRKLRRRAIAHVVPGNRFDFNCGDMPYAAATREMGFNFEAADIGADARVIIVVGRVPFPTGRDGAVFLFRCWSMSATCIGIAAKYADFCAMTASYCSPLPGRLAVSSTSKRSSQMGPDWAGGVFSRAALDRVRIPRHSWATHDHHAD